MTPGLAQVLFSRPGWVSRGASMDLDFANQRFWSGTQVRGAPEAIPGWSYSRTGVEYARTAAGTLVPFTSGVPAITDLGLSSWDARTEVVLWNRDLTNAAWTKTNATAAKDQTGMDGVASSASSITATANNGTVLQAITLASSARISGVYIKRLTGSGAVSMTMDNGATYTALTVTSSWAFQSIPTQTLANPTVGFKLATSGDAVAVDFVQNQNGVNTGPAIATTTASATRGASTALISGLVIPNPHTLFVEWVKEGDDLATFANVASLEDGSANQHSIYQRHTNHFVRGFVTSTADQTAGTASLNTVQRAAFRFETNNANGSLNGTIAGAADATVTLFTVDRLYLGSRSTGSPISGFVRRVALYPYAMSDAEMNARTAP